MERLNWGDWPLEQLDAISWEYVFKGNFRTMPYPNRSSWWRTRFGRLMGYVLHQCVAEDKDEQYRDRMFKLLMLLPRWTCQPGHRKEGPARVQLGLLERGEFSTLHANATGTPPQQAHLLLDAPEHELATRVQTPGQRAQQVKRAVQLVTVGDPARAYNTLTSRANIVEMTEDNERKVVATFPRGDQPELRPDPISPDNERLLRSEQLVTPDLLRKVLRRMKRLAGGGGSRWRLEHVLTFLRSGGDPIMLAPLINAVIEGRVPAGAKPYLYGGALTPLSKPQGGIRPIVVGEVFVRIAGAALASKCKGAAGEFLRARFQMGVGVPAGAEQMIHAVRAALAAHPDWVVFKGDITNALNSISRECIWRAAAP